MVGTTIHRLDDDNVAFVSVRSDSQSDAIRDALNELDGGFPDWGEAYVIHYESDVYVVRVSREAPDGW